MLPRPYEQGDPEPDQYPLPTFSQSHPKHLMRNAQSSSGEILASCHFEPEVRDALQFVLQNYGSKQISRRDFDTKARPWARHVAVHGRTFGLRFPTGDERLRHVGLPFAVQALNNEREKYALAGNAFHYLEIVSAFGTGDDCLASLLKGTTQPKTIQPLSPQEMVTLYQTSLTRADLPADVAPWAHASPFPYCTMYNTVSEERWSPLIVSEQHVGETVHSRRHLDLREVGSRPGQSSCRIPQTNHGFGSLFQEIAKYRPSMWVGSHQDTVVYSTNQAVSFLALQIMHRKTNTPHPVQVAQLITYLQDKYGLPFRQDLQAIQQDWSLLSKGCGEEQLDAILVYHGDICEDSFALNVRTDPFVLQGNRSRGTDDKRGCKYEVFAAALHQVFGHNAQAGEQEEEGFAVTLLRPCSDLQHQGSTYQDRA